VAKSRRIIVRHYVKKVTELAVKEVNGHEQRKRRNDWFDEEYK
jgi:hypothetical protein